MTGFTQNTTTCQCTHLTDFSVRIDSNIPTTTTTTSGSTTGTTTTAGGSTTGSTTSGTTTAAGSSTAGTSTSGGFGEETDIKGNYLSKEMIFLAIAVGFVTIIIIIGAAVVKGRRFSTDGNEGRLARIALDDEEGSDNEDDLSQLTREEEMRDYSIGSIKDLSFDSDDDAKDYSIGLENLEDDEPLEDDMLGPGITPRGNRLQRLGPSSSSTGLSTATHRSSLQTDYDLDSPRNRPQQTSTKLARARESQNQNAPKGKKKSLF